MRSSIYLVVFFDVIQTTIIRHESGDLFTIFDQLHSDALSNGGIWLFGFDTAVNNDVIMVILNVFDTYIFSRTMPLAWEAPPNGLALRAVPRLAFL